jgi:hypothetical protein
VRVRYPARRLTVNSAVASDGVFIDFRPQVLSRIVLQECEEVAEQGDQ